MSDRTKLILQIAGFAAVVLAIGFLIWWFLLRPAFIPAPTPTLPTLPTVPIAPGLPPAGPALPLPPIGPPPTPTAPPSPIATGGTTLTTTLTSTPTLAPFLAPDGTAVQYYNRTDGKFYRLRPDGEPEALTDKVFFDVSKITWSPNRTAAILEYPDGANVLYNFATGKPVTLPRHWDKFSFSPAGEGIAFLSLGLEESSRWLAVASADGANPRPIEPLGDNANKVQVAWSPNNAMIAFSRTGQPQGVNETEIYLVGQHGENFRSLVVNGLNFRGQWSPDGRTIVYSATSGDEDFKPMLWAVSGSPDAIGEAKRPLGLNTWIDKCAFASATALYCAVPQTLPRGAGLYPAVAASTPDDLYKVDLATGSAVRVAIPVESHTIDNLVVSEDGGVLYFTDKFSGQLYKINLK